MTTQPPSPDPLPFSAPERIWQRLLRLVADRNPFYLLSAACMLGGCLAMTNSLSWTSLPLTRLLVLIGTINFYEAALIGLAVLLLRRGLLRDGNILLIVQAFFLVDVTFLSAEVATANLRAGIIVNAVLFGLALVKLRLVMPALGAALSPARFAQIAVQLATLLAIPCVLRHIDHGTVTPRQFYAVWWVVGLMPAVGEGIHRLLDRPVPAEHAHTSLAGPAWAYVALPWVSLITHLGILHYVYDVPFLGAMAAPVLLGLAFVLHRVSPGTLSPSVANLLGTTPQMLVLKVLLPAAAVLVSLNNPHVLSVDLRPLVHGTLNTGVLAAAGAYLTGIYCLLPQQAFVLLGAGVFSAIAFLFGPSLQQIEQFWADAWDGGTTLVGRIIPSTVAGWGVVSVLASFVFLAIGAVVSFGGQRVALPSDTMERKAVDD